MKIEDFSSKESSIQLSTFTATKAKLCLPLESAKRITQWSAFHFTHSTSYYPVPSSQIRMQDFPNMKQQNHPYTHPNDQDLIRKWANHRGKCVRGKKPLRSRLEPFPWTCMRLSVQGGKRLDFAQNEDSKVQQEDERKGGYLEFLKQTSSHNTMTTPLMTMILYQKKMVPNLNF